MLPSLLLSVSFGQSHLTSVFLRFDPTQLMILTLNMYLNDKESYGDPSVFRSTLTIAVSEGRLPRLAAFPGGSIRFFFRFSNNE
jgi:hypothetical protein